MLIFHLLILNILTSSESDVHKHVHQSVHLRFRIICNEYDLIDG